MQTQSHFLITAVLGDRLKARNIDVSGKAVLLGSVLPDVPLLLLTIGYAVYRQTDPVLAEEFIFGPTYDALYFENPWWMMGHSLFHSPVMIALYAAIGYWALRLGHGWGRPLLWFAAGCGLHAFIDILTHVNDGPLVFFPFNWSFRIQAPVSYWDPQYGGRIFGPLENLLNLMILLYFGVKWWRARRAGAAENAGKG